MLHSHAHWLLQALYVLAVTMNTVAQVSGGAGIFCGAKSWCVSTGKARVMGVERGRAFTPVSVPPPAFAFPVLLLIFMRVCSRRNLQVNL